MLIARQCTLCGAQPKRDFLCPLCVSSSNTESTEVLSALRVRSFEHGGHGENHPIAAGDLARMQRTTDNGPRTTDYGQTSC